jgi:lipoprotein-anchoring transpeptidase ErfK/SrfK
MPCSEFELGLKKEVTERLKGLGLPSAEDCIVVSIDQQKLWHIRGLECETYVVSTARAGRGCVQDSQQTPDGLHQVCEKIGAGAVPGMVFKARQPTGKLASEWASPEDNLITSRILWLDGLESGRNRGVALNGKIVDTRRRFVYIHGTNQTDKLGQPNSHGCVLLSDADIVRLFDDFLIGTRVLIKD